MRVRLSCVFLGALAACSAVQREGATESQSVRAAQPIYLETPEGEKPRVVITADPELDDSNSLIRYLLYSSDYRTEGLIYASSQFHWAGDGEGTTLSVPGREYNRFGLDLCPCESWRWSPDERFIDDVVDAYKQVYANLSVHDPGYPTPDDLRSRIRWGNVKFDGEMSEDTPGSDLIKSLLLDDEESPVYLHAWGGQSTIARALRSIEEEYAGTTQWPAIRAQVIRKAVIHPSGDQDDTYANYIQPSWPEIRYRQQAGSVPLAYNVQSTVSEEDAQFFTADWMRANVISQGPFGQLMRVWGDGREMVEGDIFDYFGIANKSAEDLRAEGYIVWTPPHAKDEFLAEGDTATFLNLVDNGLRGYRGDSFGGWGGYARSGPVGGGFAGFGDALADFETGGEGGFERQSGPRSETHRFLAAAQRDWAARLNWSVTSAYEAVNHNPVITLAGSNMIAAAPGARLELLAETSDPDGDAVGLEWWIWDEAGSYRGQVTLSTAEGSATLRVPIDAEPGHTIQVIAEATDNGVLPLTRYEKVVVTVSR